MSARRLGPLLVVTGPTATGKTAAALALARELDGELVGADSVQVYRGFDIGSAKPTADELGSVAHHLIDVADPDETFDAMRYAALADAAIAAVRARGRVPIVVGGTGLWLRALLRGLVDVPLPDPAVRAALDAEAEREGTPHLHRRLASVDRLAAATIHQNDRIRIVRALEVFEQTGRPMGELRAEHALGAPRYDAFVVGLDAEREEHARLIATRTSAMIAAGFADEVRRIVDRWGAEVRGLGAVGYREMLRHVTAGEPLEETSRKIERSTKIYARRQRTWLKNEPGTTVRTTAAGLLSDRELRARIRAHMVPPGRGGRAAD